MIANREAPRHSARPRVQFNRDARLAEPRQLYAWECEQPMYPAQAHKHLLVYRCDDRTCGRHSADIPDVEGQLLYAYCRTFGLSTTDCERSPDSFVKAMLAALDIAWVCNRRVVQAHTQFHKPTPQ